MYVHMYLCKYVCMYVHMYVRMYVCMYVCMYVAMYTLSPFAVDPRYNPQFPSFHIKPPIGGKERNQKHGLAVILTA